MLTSMGTSSCRLTLRGVDMANDERRAHVTTRARSLAHDNRADVLNNFSLFFLLFLTSIKEQNNSIRIPPTQHTLSTTSTFP